MFWGWWWTEKRFFVQKWHFLKVGKHYLCSAGKKSAHFRCNYLFWENGPFFGAHSKSPNTTKNRGFSRHGGKSKMALLVAKVPFWVFPWKGFTICDSKSLSLLKTLFYSVFKQNTALQTWKSVTWKKTKNYQKSGGCLP